MGEWTSTLHATGEGVICSLVGNAGSLTLSKPPRIGAGIFESFYNVSMGTRTNETCLNSRLMAQLSSCLRDYSTVSGAVQ